MRQKLTCLILVLVPTSILLASQAVRGEEPVAQSGKDVRRLTTQAMANNALACDLYRQVSESEGNVLFSPVSIGSLLGMLEAGAKGETKQEIRTVLRMPVKNDKHQASLLRMIEKDGEGFQLKSANRFWGRTGANFEMAFRDEILKKYAADLVEVDFSEGVEVRDRINDWVEQKTNGKIQKLLSSPLSSEVQLVLTNAIYFKGKWEHRFDPKFTRNRPFYVNAQKQISVPMMVRTEKFRFWESPSVKIVELPYAGNAFSAIVVLPVKRDGLRDLEKEMTAANLRQWLTSLDSAADKGKKEPPKIMVSLPRFTLSTQMQLEQVLRAMGLKSAFGEQADLSGIARERLILSQVIHKAFMEVDEKGTVAAAVTGGIASSGIPPAFTADHPFIFMIRDQETGAIVFLARIENPGELLVDGSK